MDQPFWLRLAAGAAFLAVALGAFGAHALKGSLTEEMRAVFETGVRYQFYHALALFVVAYLAGGFPSRAVDAAGLCFAAGILLFSGSLYTLALTGIRGFGAVTPVGGFLFLFGWGCLTLAPYTK